MKSVRFLSMTVKAVKTPTFTCVTVGQAYSVCFESSGGSSGSDWVCSENNTRHKHTKGGD